MESREMATSSLHGSIAALKFINDVDSAPGGKDKGDKGVEEGEIKGSGRE